MKGIDFICKSFASVPWWKKVISQDHGVENESLNVRLGEHKGIAKEKDIHI